MNFKPNAWTLLFALALGALLFNLFGNGGTVRAAGLDCGSEPVDEIPSSEAGPEIIDYTLFVDDENRHFYDSIKTHTNLLNPEANSFAIKKCELYEMIEAYADSGDGENENIYAYLAIKDGGANKDTLDLIFSDQYKDKPGVKFFDFTIPCPPVCPK